MIATYFVGIWTPTIKEPVGGRPSPWCLWELGAAAALQKPVAVVIQNGMSVIDHSYIYGERFRFGFNDSDQFKEAFGRACRSVLRDAKEAQIISSAGKAAL